MDTTNYKQMEKRMKGSSGAIDRAFGNIMGELLAEIDRLTEENKRIEEERQMYITLALRYQKDAEENEPVWAELEGLENQVNRLWGNKAPSMVKVIVRAKAMLEQWKPKED